MSHQRHLSHDPIKEPHSISLKVLRLSRPSLVTQHPVRPPPASSTLLTPPVPASLAYTGGSPSSPTGSVTNPDPFLISPIVNLPPSFGSAYVGEHFSCTLCANYEIVESASSSGAPKKQIRDVKIEAEMKTPGSSGGVHKLELTGVQAQLSEAGGLDLQPGQTLQRVVGFDLKDEGNHVLAVTVSYYEATETSGRTRTFRKLYQFICKSSLIVRTKVGAMPATPEGDEDPKADEARRTPQRWVLEAQLENCSDDIMQLESVMLDLEPGLSYTDCNWAGEGGNKPVLHPGEVQQVCFLVEETPGSSGLQPNEDGRMIFGVLGIGWRGEMGNKGFLSTGRLGTRVAA